MKRKMQCFALRGKCGGRSAIGLSSAAAASWASSASKVASASVPIPLQERRSISRLEKGSPVGLIDIDELITVQQDATEPRQAVFAGFERGVERVHEFAVSRSRRPAQSNLECSLDLLAAVGA